VSFFAENWILFLVALSSGAMLMWPLVQRSAGGSQAVGTAEAVRLINRERGVLIDVAEPAEFAQSHARGARNVPLGQLDGSKDLPKDKSLPVILLCPSGARAGRAATQLRKAGYERAVAVTGGTRAWNDASLPIARGDEDAKSTRPADKSDKAEKAEKGKAGAKEGRSGKRGKTARAEARETQGAVAAAAVTTVVAEAAASGSEAAEPATTDTTAETSGDAPTEVATDPVRPVAEADQAAADAAVPAPADEPQAPARP
jgi:rhodanese-related sulfurtransferase